MGTIILGSIICFDHIFRIGWNGAKVFGKFRLTLAAAAEMAMFFTQMIINEAVLNVTTLFEWETVVKLVLMCTKISIYTHLTHLNFISGVRTK